MDLSLSVATGRPWLGTYGTLRGPVLYIVGEGLGGFPARRRAWGQEHGFSGRAGVSFIREPVGFDAPSQVDKLLRTLEGLDGIPSLIVVDTLARCIIGDENQTHEMGRFLAGIGQVQRATDAAVLVLHHTGHDKRRERGSTALRASADAVMLVVAPKSGHRELHCEKQRDAELFSPIAFRLRPVTLADGTSSCVVESIGCPLPARVDLLASAPPLRSNQCDSVASNVAWDDGRWWWW
jgi:hypothetical protein